MRQCENKKKAYGVKGTFLLIGLDYRFQESILGQVQRNKLEKNLAENKKVFLGLSRKLVGQIWSNDHQFLSASQRPSEPCNKPKRREKSGKAKDKSPTKF